MKLSIIQFHRRSRQAFTLIEITICLTVIVVGLVAVLGVLPAGIESQKKNRESTIMDMEGNYFLEAIRNGATNFVTGRFVDSYTQDDTTWTKFQKPEDVIGILSTPRVVTRSAVRTFSGNAAEKGDDVKDFAMRYLMTTEIVPFKSFHFDQNSTSESYKQAQHIQTNLWEIRITLQWPVLPGQNPLNVGLGKRVFRALTSSQLISNNIDGKPQWIFHPTTYIRSGEKP